MERPAAPASAWSLAPALAPALALALALVAFGTTAVAQTPEPGAARRSGFADMSPALQRLQTDDTQNPAWLWLKDSEQRFGSDCARCHAGDDLRSVAARYPAFDTALGKPVTLAGRVNLCRTRHLDREALAVDGDALLGLTTYLGWLARGLSIAPQADPRLAPAREAGQRLWRTRFGQLDFSCAQCHDDQAGRRLAGSTIPQAHPGGYPTYRMAWQGMGSLQRRMRGCMTAVRAEPFAADSDAWVALELYLMQRAAGMPVETPAVRP